MAQNIILETTSFSHKQKVTMYFHLDYLIININLSPGTETVGASSLLGTAVTPVWR